MFRMISIVCFVVVFVAIVLHWFCRQPRFNDMFGKDRKLKILDIIRLFMYFILMLLPQRKHNAFGILKKLVIILACICFAVLFITGFTPVIVLNIQITGFWMIIHATAAPIFAFCLMALAVMAADENKFDKNYMPQLTKMLNLGSVTKEHAEKFELTSKFLFWGIITLAVPLIASIVLGMLPLFGTDTQKLLLTIHKYTALIISTVIILYGYVSIRIRISENS